MYTLWMDYINYAGESVHLYWPLYDNLYECTWYGGFFSRFLETLNGATDIVWNCKVT